MTIETLDDFDDQMGQSLDTIDQKAQMLIAERIRLERDMDDVSLSRAGRAEAAAIHTDLVHLLNWLLGERERFLCQHNKCLTPATRGKIEALHRKYSTFH